MLEVVQEASKKLQSNNTFTAEARKLGDEIASIVEVFKMRYNMNRLNLQAKGPIGSREAGKY